MTDDRLPTSRQRTLWMAAMLLAGLALAVCSEESAMDPDLRRRGSAGARAHLVVAHPA